MGLWTGLFGFLLPAIGEAQTEPGPADSGPAAAPPTATSAPTATPEPPPAVAPVAPPPAPTPVAPPPAYTEPPPSAYTPPAYSGGGAPQPPPPPLRKPNEGFRRPTLSFRVDPVNWLLYGRLGFELESEILSFLSVELVPVFVVNDSPPSLDLEFNENTLTQHSNGIGALAGTSVGLGFWLSGKPLRGTVLRAILTNYGFTYRANDELGVFDEVSHTERHFYGFIGSNSTWGIFTLAGGFGLGVELNKERRCFVGSSPSMLKPTSDCEKDDQLIRLDRRAATFGDLNSSTHPVQILFRLSLGVTF